MEELILSVSQGYISIDWINRIHCTMICFKRLNRSYQLHKAIFPSIESIVSIAQCYVSSDWIDHIISYTRLCFKRLNRSYQLHKAMFQAIESIISIAQGYVLSDWFDHIECVHFPVLVYISAHWVLRMSQSKFHFKSNKKWVLYANSSIWMWYILLYVNILIPVPYVIVPFI